jgi:hypothetical protein
VSDEPYAFGPTDPYPGAPRVQNALPGGPPGAERGADLPQGGAPAPWGAQPPVEGRKRMSTFAKGLTAAGVAAVIAVGGTVAVTSANADNSTAAPAAMQQLGGEGSGATGATGGTAGTGRSGGFGGGMASRSLVAGALHGEFVVADGSGTVTERLQTGVITNLSATSLSVKSTDDFAATYAVASGTDVSSLATGATVTVIATVDGTTATVASISTAAQGGTGSGGTGGFTPPDGSVSGGDGSGRSGTGTGGTSSGGTGSGDSGV